MGRTRTRRVTRREFVGTAAAAVAGAPAILRGQNLNNKLNIAVIGAGGRGRANLKGVSSENIVALCDVDLPALDRVGAAHPDARKVTDFRKLFNDPVEQQQAHPAARKGFRGLRPAAANDSQFARSLHRMDRGV
jgi:hypothetical protein